MYYAYPITLVTRPVTRHVTRPVTTHVTRPVTKHVTVIIFIIIYVTYIISTCKFQRVLQHFVH